MSDIRAKVNKALEAIGTKNGTAPPESQDPLDAFAHEYGICSQGMSYFDKRRDNAKKALLSGLGPAGNKKLQATKAHVAETEVKQDIEVGRGQFYIVLAEVKTGASYLDEAALRVELLKKMKKEEVDALIFGATRRRDPSVSLKVVENE